MKEFKVKRIYEPRAENDGFRVFVDRMWPRGKRKQDLEYDLWAKDLAPSTELRRWYHEDIEGRWEEFSRRYEQELADGHAADYLRDYVVGFDIVTLLYAAKDETRNHALVLADYLRNRF
ncbi:MAG: DUF488 family protein [Rikenellaceae bacterium]|nr:DUF488 family protein [Rikenellaceae bacterium]